MSEVKEMEYVINFDSLFVQLVGKAGLIVEGFYMRALLILVLCACYFMRVHACASGLYAYMYYCVFMCVIKLVTC